MTNFLPRMASSDTEAAKAAMEHPLQGVLASKACTASHSQVMACLRKHPTTNTPRLRRPTDHSANKRRHPHETVLAARTCRATTVPGRRSLRSINSNIPQVIQPGTVACRMDSAVLEAAFLGPTTGSDINQLVSRAATRTRSVDMANPVRWLEDQARLPGCGLDQLSTTCRVRADSHRRRARGSKGMADTLAI